MPGLDGNIVPEIFLKYDDASKISFKKHNKSQTSMY